MLHKTVNLNKVGKLENLIKVLKNKHFSLISDQGHSLTAYVVYYCLSIESELFPTVFHCILSLATIVLKLIFKK